MTKTGSFDLFCRMPGRIPEAVLILSPYVEAEFFTRVVREMRPKDLHVIIDDGCRREDLQTVRDAVKAGAHKRPIYLKLGSARGLVHLKLFYTRWRTTGGRVAHSLVFGSANATRQGFSGTDNGELVAWCSLTRASHAQVLTWCDQVINATRLSEEVSIPAARDAEVATGLKVRLPAITIGRQVATVSNFDLWVQRGFLLSPFRADASFLRVQVLLAKPLPPGEQARMAENAGFETPQARSISHPYIDDGMPLGGHDLHEKDESWRASLFTRTQLGDWCSEEVHQAREGSFRRAKHERRQKALIELGKLGHPAERAAARDNFLTKLEGLWRDLGDEAGGYLRQRNSGIDLPHYRKVFEDRVTRDQALADDAEFRNRYVAGFELVAVPRFRNDVEGWRGFVDSLGRQLVLDNTRKRPRSKLLKAIREVVSNYNGEEDPLADAGSLIEFLRNIWMAGTFEGASSASVIANYHQR